MFGRRPPKPDPALLARVTGDAEVDLGSYAEAALAVTGAYPARGSLDHRDQDASSFRCLDSQSRQAAMQAALDRLTADGTIQVPAGPRLESVVADGLDGKLAVTGLLADLYQLCFYFHRRGYSSGMVIDMSPGKDTAVAQLPPGVPPPGLESCFAVPSDNADEDMILLVERPDREAGTRGYTLRTLRREFTRLAAFLFADVITGEQALQAEVNLWFRFGQNSLRVENKFIRKAGEDVAYGQMKMQGPRKKQEPRYVKVSAADLTDMMTKYFVSASARAQ